MLISGFGPLKGGWVSPKSSTFLSPKKFLNVEGFEGLEGFERFERFEGLEGFERFERFEGLRGSKVVWINLNKLQHN